MHIHISEHLLVDDPFQLSKYDTIIAMLYSSSCYLCQLALLHHQYQNYQL